MPIFEGLGCSTSSGKTTWLSLFMHILKFEGDHLRQAAFLDLPVLVAMANKSSAGGLLDAGIAMVPLTEGGCTPVGQRPLCVLPVSIGSGLLLTSRTGPLSAFSAGRGLSTSKKCPVTPFWEIPICLLLMWSNQMTRLCGMSWTALLAGRVSLFGSVKCTSHFTKKFGFGSSVRMALV